MTTRQSTTSDTRRCAKCGHDRPLTDFTLKVTGCRIHQCRLCRNAAARARYAKSGPYHRPPYIPKKRATEEQLFWRHVDKTGGPGSCWTWTASRLKAGYGQGRLHGRSTLAHRVSYELAYGPIPDGLCVLHKCDNPPCCNPAHLFLGTHADNSADKVTKGRQARGDNTTFRKHPEMVQRGERSRWSKLSEHEVRAIRHAYATGGTSYSKLAAQYHVSFSGIGRIVRGETWKHVT